MEREVFRKHFLEAAAQAREFGQKYVLEQLPLAMRFRVAFNRSSDGDASPTVRLFPKDSRRRIEADADGVVEALWRDGYIPQWIDIAIADEDGATTVLQLDACGRFSDDDSTLYYQRTPVAPFGVKGPFFPSWMGDAATPPKFSIHDRSECWTRADFERKRANAALVNELTLRGEELDDDTLCELDFPRCYRLDLQTTRIHGSGLAGLRGIPLLRRLSIRRASLTPLSLASLPPLDRLETIELEDLPRRVDGLRTLANAAPKLRHLSLSAVGNVNADDVVFRSLRSLTVDLPVVPPWIKAETLESAYVHVPNGTDETTWRLIEPSASTIEHLDLQRTKVTDAFLSCLDALPKLQVLDSRGTRITRDALATFAAGRPHIRCLGRSHAR